MNEPTVLRKTYTAPYVLDRGKLSRMLTIIEQRCAEEKMPYQPGFEVVLRNGKMLMLTSSQDMFSLDNAIKNPIRSLAVRLPSDADEEFGERRVVLRFDSDRYSNIGIVVGTPNTKWATELFAELEEQVDRTLVSNWIVRAFRSFSFEVLFFIAIVVFLLAMFILGVTKSRAQFTDSEAAALRLRLTSARNDSERLQALVDVKLREIDAARPKRLLDFNWQYVLSKRGLFVALPIVMLVGTFVYMVATCYPWAVFSWGDYEQYYAALVARRRTLWSVVIASLVLGIVTNLFVVSLPALQ